ncbi:MAG: ATP-binding protein [Caldilineaceae bacterium]|nr:ATP-binding protein [Caldilineaceae bacterium]
MNRSGIKDALQLGASDTNYPPDSLSKFGLGLKSAAFSQGEQLEVVSSEGNDPFAKYVVSLPEIRERREYGAVQEELSPNDCELIRNYLPERRGTIIRITEVRTKNHPSIRATFRELQQKLGIIYYYMMPALRIYLVDKEGGKTQCEPYDVLFAEEADRNGDLNEFEWDGQTTRWIQRQREITLDPADNVKARIEVTQLPYPPIFENPAEIRKKYNISAGNYGFYVYRNKRLLSWAESFEIITQDQDFYAFRGRILIDSSADEVFNIDVKKSQLHLSEEAHRALSDGSDHFKRKSKKAWKSASEERLRRLNEDSLGQANDIASEIELPEELPGELPDPDKYEEIDRRRKSVSEKQKTRLKDLAKEMAEEIPEFPEIETESNGEFTEEQLQTVVTAEGATINDRIFMVSITEDNVLWEPFYYSNQDCVRINKFHRFSRLIYEDNKDNGTLTVFLNLLLLHMSAAEFYVIQSNSRFKQEQIESILAEYRRVVTDYLAHLCREYSQLLPSDS